MTAVLSDRPSALDTIADSVLPALAAGNHVIVVASTESRSSLASAAFCQMAENVRTSLLSGNEGTPSCPALISYCPVKTTTAHSDVTRALFSPQQAPEKVCYFGTSSEKAKAIRELGAVNVSRVAVG